LQKARRTTRSQADAWGLIRGSQRFGVKWDPKMYLTAVDFERDDDIVLRRFFGEWPLTPSSRGPNDISGVSEHDLSVLVNMFKELGVPRDRLPYHPKMAQLTRKFGRHLKRRIKPGEVWELLLKKLKRAKKRPPKRKKR
jgi:hypothetical protein